MEEVHRRSRRYGDVLPLDEAGIVGGIYAARESGGWDGNALDI